MFIKMSIKLAFLTLLSLFLDTNSKSYDETLAKKLLPLASAAYGSDPTACLKNVYGSAELIERYEPICDSSDTDTCSGYLAVIHSEKVIAVVFRGTTTDLQLNFEKIAALLPKPEFAGMGNVNKYFFDAFFAIWNDGMGKRFNKLVNEYKDYGLWVTGHSLGAAISSLASAQILKDYSKFNRDNSVHYNYGQPRVGDKSFSISHSQLLPDFYRVTHAQDLVTMLPSADLGFMHHKLEVWYNNTMAPKSEYVFCDEEDDPNCAGPVRDSWTDHRNYFGIKVTQYGPDGCKTPIA